MMMLRGVTQRSIKRGPTSRLFEQEEVDNSSTFQSGENRTNTSHSMARSFRFASIKLPDRGKEKETVTMQSNELFPNMRSVSSIDGQRLGSSRKIKPSFIPSALIENSPENETNEIANAQGYITEEMDHAHGVNHPAESAGLFSDSGKVEENFGDSQIISLEKENTIGEQEVQNGIIQNSLL